MKRYTVEIDIELDILIGQYKFIDVAVLSAKFDHQGGYYASTTGIHPDDEPHEIEVITAIVQWENGQTTDAHQFLDVEEILLSNIDKWEEE